MRIVLPKTTSAQLCKLEHESTHDCHSTPQKFDVLVKDIAWMRRQINALRGNTKIYVLHHFTNCSSLAWANYLIYYALLMGIIVPFIPFFFASLSHSFLPFDSYYFVHYLNLRFLSFLFVMWNCITFWWTSHNEAHIEMVWMLACLLAGEVQ